MSISGQQICALQAGDVIYFDSVMAGRCYTAVLEHEGSKLVLSAIAKNMESIHPIRSTQWEYLVVDDVGNICDKDGDDAVSEMFVRGTVLPGRALHVVHKYRKRIMPNMKMVRDGCMRFEIDAERSRAVGRTIFEINAMVFNDDFHRNIPLLSEMFVRLVKDAPVQELPLYLTRLLTDIEAFKRIQTIVALHDAISEEFSPEEDTTLSTEAQEAILKAKNKTS